MQARSQPGRPNRRLALLLEYDGTRYAGSQFQTNGPTIQAEVETAIKRTTGEDLRVVFAGRTDAGVHALGQVAAFSTSSLLDAETLRDALNAWLPEEVAVLAAAEVDAAFDPRRDAVRRHYRYVIENRRAKPALDRKHVWHVAQPLDVDAMAAAASLLLGERDFAAFAGRLDDPEASTVRRLACFAVRREGSRIVFQAAANAFLPHQVRRMVGALVNVGLGKLTPEQYRALLDGPSASAGPAAPARGLFLVRVEYRTDPFGFG